jgi:hypothetical protein
MAQSFLGIFMDFPMQSRQITGQYLEINNAHFLPNPFKFTVNIIQKTDLIIGNICTDAA